MKRKSKKVLRNWVKITLLILFWIVGAIVISKLVCTSTINFENYANECDREKETMCNYYEVQMFIKTGNYQ